MARKDCDINQEISAELVTKNQKFIDGTIVKITNSYSLSEDDREDIRCNVHLKICSFNWARARRRKSIKNYEWYLKSLILNCIRRTVREIQACGKTGTKNEARVPITNLFRDGELPQTETEHTQEHVTQKSQEDQLAAKEVSDVAKKVLSDQEWKVVSIHFGFDGGSGLTTAQVASELGMTRTEVTEAIESSMFKVRQHLRLRSLSTETSVLKD